MKVVGLTGGIGSGKSTIAKMFSRLGIAVYIADDEAKLIMNTNNKVKQKIISLLGEQAYLDGVLNRVYVAQKIFGDTSLLNQMNGIVHPAVAEHFTSWKNKQNSPYVIKEAAILFENGAHTQCDYTILVTAPEEVRIDRVVKRDDATREQILSRIRNQWDDAQKIPLADFVIDNIKFEDTENQVEKIHLKILS